MKKNTFVSPISFKRSSRRLVFEPLEHRNLLTASIPGVVISEFVADNSSTCYDGSGTASDWIELYNPTEEAVDISGWYLTDKPKKVSAESWSFPENTILRPGDYLKVFTGGETVDGKRDSAGNLAADFGLSKDGDTIALFNKDLTKIVQIDFGPQQEDVSYGLRQSSQNLFEPSSTAKYLVPKSESDYNANWYSQNFDASTWKDGTAAVGFDSTSSTFDVKIYQGNTNSTVDLTAALARINGTPTVTGSPTVIDYHDNAGVSTAGTGHFQINNSLPGGNRDYYTLVATADVYIPAGKWTFGCASDDGFRLTIKNDAGNTVLTTSFAGNRGIAAVTPTDYGTADFAEGTYHLEFVGYDGGSASGFEVFATEGEYTSFNSSEFKLVGDTAHGGLMISPYTKPWETPLAALAAVAEPVAGTVTGTDQGTDSGTVAGETEGHSVPLRSDDSITPGFDVTVYFSNQAVNSASVAISVISTPSYQTGVVTDRVSVIDFAQISNGSFGVNNLFPGTTTTSVDSNDHFVLTAKGDIIIPEAGYYTFSVGSDDGFVLQISGTGGNLAMEHTGVRAFASSVKTAYFEAGVYSVDLMFFECTGGAGVEFSAAKGEYEAFDASAFKLVGDTANGGLAINTMSGFYSTSVSKDMYKVNSSLLIRSEFTVDKSGSASPEEGMPDWLAMEALYMNVRYNDGFVAYLNGTEILRVNAPETLAWNSTSTVSRNLYVSTQVESINITEYKDLLIDGANVLAVQVLNSSAESLDCLFSAEIVGIWTATETITTESTDESGNPAPVQTSSYIYQYTTSPTPGTANISDGVRYICSDVEFSEPHGWYTETIDVELSCETEGSTIVYTTNGSEPMLIDGTVTNGTEYVPGTQISISSTTVIRAMAFADDSQSSFPTSASYMYLSDILTQSVPPEGFPQASVNGQVFDYGMDTDITSNGTWSDKLDDAFASIATVTLTTDTANLFNNATGIYVNPMMSGREWEREATIEMIYPDELVDLVGQYVNGEVTKAQVLENSLLASGCYIDLKNMIEAETDPAVLVNYINGFQMECGVRIRGGFSRTNTNPRHSFRIFFRSEYGGYSTLEYPIFGTEAWNGVEAAQEFDRFDLRTSQNYSWSYSGSGDGNANTFVRDSLIRVLEGIIGDPSTKGRYYHLFLNGVYWGVYETEERAGGDYAESYLGGEDDDKDQYDVVKTESTGPYNVYATDGNMDLYTDLWEVTTKYFAPCYTGADKVTDTALINEAYYRIQGLNADGTEYTGTDTDSYHNLLDVQNVIDYAIMTYYFNITDGAGSYSNKLTNNYQGIINRENPEGFVYLLHDNEHSLGLQFDANLMASQSYHSFIADTTLNSLLTSTYYFNPHYLHECLMSSVADYRTAFADRVYELLYNDGTLDAENVIEYWDEIQASMGYAMVAESARWGDARDDSTNNPKTYDTWVAACNSAKNFLITKDWAGNITYRRDAKVIDLLRSLKVTRSNTAQSPAFYPSINPPEFNSSLAYTPDDPLITIPESPAGAGSMRLYKLTGTGTGTGTEADGEVLITASAIPNGVSIYFTLDGTDPRALGGAGPSSTAMLYTAQSGASGTDTSGTETASSTEDIKAAIIAADQPYAMFNARAYNKSTGEWSALTYAAVYADEPSVYADTVVINEVMTNPADVSEDVKGRDFVELYNPTDKAVDLSGWILIDSDLTEKFSTTKKIFTIPEGTVLQPGEYLVYYEQLDDEPDAFTFGLSKNGEAVYLLQPAIVGSEVVTYTDKDARVFSIVDTVTAPALEENQTFARVPDGTVQFTTELYATPGQSNRADIAESLKITEIYYNPSDQTATELNKKKQFEYFEIHNSSSTQLMDLSGLVFNCGFTVANETYLAPGEYAVLALNPDAFNERFGTTYKDLKGAEHSIRVLGAYTEDLGNSTDTIAIYPAETVLTEATASGGETGIQPLVSVTYYDTEDTANGTGFWPEAPDGDGASLELWDSVSNSFDASLNPNLGASWRASVVYGGTPGRAAYRAVRPAVIINEVSTHTDAPDRDFIELYNPTSDSIDLSGWYLTDKAGEPLQFAIPTGTAIGAGQYLVFYQYDDYNAEGQHEDDSENEHEGIVTANNFEFGLSQAGESVYITSPDSRTGDLILSDPIVFGASANGLALGRWGYDNDSLLANQATDALFLPSGAWTLLPMKPTPGAVNSAPVTGPVIINEINYHPIVPDSQTGVGQTETAFEYIELLINSTTDVDLSGWKIGGSTVDEGIMFTFPASVGTEVGEDSAGLSNPFVATAGSTILLVGFNPSDADALAVFAQKYRLAVDSLVPGTNIFQWTDSDAIPETAALSNTGGVLSVFYPHEDKDEGTTWYFLSDQVAYNCGDSSGAETHLWPTEPNGNTSLLYPAGAVLQRLAPADTTGTYLHGSDPTGWAAGNPSPGNAGQIELASVEMFLLDTPSERTATELPEQTITQINEWTPYFLEFWAISDTTVETKISSFTIDLKYDASLFDAVWTLDLAQSVSMVPDESDPNLVIVTFSFGQVGSVKLGAGEILLLGDLQFKPKERLTDGSVGMIANTVQPINTAISAASLVLVGDAPAEEGQPVPTATATATACNDLTNVSVKSVPYDFDNNGVVDMTDFICFARVFNGLTTEEYLSGLTDQMKQFVQTADFDASGVVDMTDFIYFARNFNAKIGSTIIYPEPAEKSSELPTDEPLAAESQSVEPAVAEVPLYQKSVLSYAAIDVQAQNSVRFTSPYDHRRAAAHDRALQALLNEFEMSDVL